MRAKSKPVHSISAAEYSNNSKDLKMKKKHLLYVIGSTAVLIAIFSFILQSQTDNHDWPVTGGGKTNIKYSSLKQIDTNNVSRLQVAWVYHSENNDSTKFEIMECNPIVIGRTLFGVSPKMKLFAIDAVTGKEKWHFDPLDSIANKIWHRGGVNMNRGVTYWAEGKDQRIIYTTGPIVLEVNVNTGRLISSFGKNGGINLAIGLDRDPKKLSVTPTSPVMIYKNLFFVGGAVNEETPGHIRAFDVKTGVQKWIFHTVPYPGEAGYKTWQDKKAYKWVGSTNSWGGFSLDEKRGILYAPIGSPTNDFYGGNRLGKGLYGNCLVALNAVTGKLLWNFQNVHHDVWDMDLPTPPSLITVMHNGKKTDAVAQTTKTGFVFVLDRVTGKPIFPIIEKPVHTNTSLEGERLWPTQPFPVLPKPFARQTITEADLNTLVSASSFQDIKRRFHTYRSDGIFTPPSVKGTLVFPGYDGGGEWGGGAVDPETNIMYINNNEMAWVLNMVKNKEVKNSGKSNYTTNLEAGKGLYMKNCMGCHGPQRLGGGNYPSLIGVEKKYNTAQFFELLSTGRRMMPGFNQLTKTERLAIASFILNLKTEQKKPYSASETLAKSNIPPQQTYGFTGYNKFLTKDGYPAISPPWGTLTAINLNTGKQVWKIPFGEFEELKAKGIPTTGRENFGGPVVTAGGLLFIAATADGKFRAISKSSGKILFETDLPAAGSATPAVYSVDGKEYVVIACGGSKNKDVVKKSDTYVAFSLPTNQ